MIYSTFPTEVVEKEYIFNIAGDPMKRSIHLKSIILLAVLFAFLFSAHGCMEDDDNSVEGGGVEGGGGKQFTDGDDHEFTEFSQCEGSCDGEDPFCIGEDLCSCELVSWQLLNCNTQCSLEGKISVGCGRPYGWFYDECFCEEAADGDNGDDDDNEQQIPACGNEDFASVAENAQIKINGDDKAWIYNGFSSESAPLDIFSFENYTSYGAPGTAGTYPIGVTEGDYKDCGFCLLIHDNCNVNADGDLVCGKTFMPKPGGTFTLGTLGIEIGETFAGSVDNVELREVSIASDLTTTVVPNGETWCIDHYEFSTTLTTPGFVDMEPPEGLSCGYPDAPFYFIGPEPGEDSPEPGTVPPMGWDGAYFNDEQIGFNLAEFRCDHPEIKTLFLMVGAGWCSACSDFFRNQVCNDGGLEETLHGLGSEILYVIGDGTTPGVAATNSYANQRMNYLGCDGGYRISDTDNNAGKRVIWGSTMFSAIPWAAVVRMKDMKLTHEQGEAYYLNFEAIATENLGNE